MCLPDGEDWLWVVGKPPGPAVEVLSLREDDPAERRNKMQNPGLDCGCSEGFLCPEGARLWAEVKTEYEVCREKPSADYRWDGYYKAVEIYRRHRGEGWHGPIMPKGGHRN